MEVATELVPRPLGRDFQKVLASQLSFGDLGEGPAAAPSTTDRTYDSNDVLWRDILDERVRRSRTLRLKDFALSEWFPLSPGLFYTREAQTSREIAQQFVLTASDVGSIALADLEREIGRHVPSEMLDRATREMTRVYSPTGKVSMMGGGVGCVRLERRRLAGDDVWFMSASSTPRAHEGFPVALPNGLYQDCLDRVAEVGGVRCDLVGRLESAADGFDPLFRQVVGVPRVYLVVDEITIAEPREETFIATGAITFRADDASVDRSGGGSEWDPADRLHGAYVTFAPGQPGSVGDAVDWLADKYVRGLFGGQILTDFDEQLPRFHGASFGLREVTARNVQPDLIEEVVEDSHASAPVQRLFVRRATRLSSAGRDFFVSYTAADRRWAEWIAWQLEAAGHTAVMQGWDFVPGGDWVHEMQIATTSSRRTICVLSPAYVRSAHGEAEWRGAYEDDPSGEGGRLVPVRIKECEAPGLLRTRICIDLVGLDEARARDALLSGIEQRRAKPTHSPSFPGSGTPAFPAP
jgi:TIR domain